MITLLYMPAIADAEFLHRRPAALFQNLLQMRIRAVRDNQSLTGNNAYEMMELPLNCRNILKNIGMVKLKIIQDRNSGSVMNKF